MNERDFNEIFAFNLKSRMEDKDVSQNELARYLNVSPTSVNNWCRGLKTPRMDKIDRLCKFFNISRSDLMEDRRIAYHQKVNALRIPVLGAVPAGIPIEAIEDIIDWEDISLNDFDPSFQYFGLRVQGDSMIPKYIEGDTIIVKVQADCESGEDAVVYVNGYDATLKKVFKQPFGIMLQPLNPEYEPIFYDYSDETHPVNIVGVVVEIRRKV